MGAVQNREHHGGETHHWCLSSIMKAGVAEAAPFFGVMLTKTIEKVD